MKPQTPDNEVAYSPLRISLILHCYSRADWIENEQAPAVQEELKRLVDSGMLQTQQPVPHYKLTPRGLDFVKTLLATPFPARLAPAPEEPCKCGYGPHWNEWNGVCSDCGRTRRPLPVQEEMPLEKELDYLTREASRASDIHNHVLILDCLRHLRDEIQKLKEAR